MARDNNNSKVSASAWNAALKDIDNKFKAIEKKIDGKKSSNSISVAAWDAMLNDFNERFNKIEERLDKISSKVDGKVSVNAWNKANEEFSDKLKNKVNVKAWEVSLVDLSNQFKELALNELKELDDRLDKTVELVNDLTNHLNEKVNITAWDRLCESNEQLIKRVDELMANHNDFTRRVSEVEKVINEAKVSEAELKKLLESI